MKRLISFLLLLMMSLQMQAGSADTLELSTIYQDLLNKHPLAEQSALLAKSSRLTLENIRTGYLPQLSLNAQATYQSEVTKVELGFPESFPVSPDQIKIPEVNKDMYKATLDVNQMIYDGGITAHRKDVEEVSLEINRKEVDVEFHQLKQRINQLYFSVLMFEKQKEQMLLRKRDIESRLDNLRSAVESGTVLKSNARELEAELLKIDQQLESIDASRVAAVKAIRRISGKKMPLDITCKLPDLNLGNMKHQFNSRPEMEKISLQKEQLGFSKDLLKAKKRPRLVGFGQLGYGRPGLNMLSDELDSFYLLGAKLQWNIWDWDQNKNERKILNVKRALLDNRQEVMKNNFDAALKPVLADIEKYNSLLMTDKEIIELREEIAESAASQLENGTITSTEYLIKVNAESRARLDREVHRIKLVHAKLQYLEITGQLEKIIK
ncbi:MAG: TolC family protein [Bacteroidales bacterium]|nr:TolC family protein [Bacteroidales bacterium]